MAEFPFAAPQPLRAIHETAQFDCGKVPLNDFLRKHALASGSGGSARTFVLVNAKLAVVGYYSLTAASLLHDEVPDRVRQGQPRHPIPAILMARFAVDLSHQGHGLGKALFRDALLRSLNITEELGARAFVVDAKDEEAELFYTRYGMVTSPGNPHRLYLLFKDVKRILTS